jgi:hypothetical protein
VRKRSEEKGKGCGGRTDVERKGNDHHHHAPSQQEHSDEAETAVVWCCRVFEEAEDCAHERKGIVSLASKRAEGRVRVRTEHRRQNERNRRTSRRPHKPKHDLQTRHKHGNQKRRKQQYGALDDESTQGDLIARTTVVVDDCVVVFPGSGGEEEFVETCASGVELERVGKEDEDGNADLADEDEG